ncbi:hypothetical protein GCM10011611_42560 [Aliidongia dinghuensis]|uniref:Uncharacterized protein n=1 Tax=Aliidongia dinghuensis TaxID=1867774 RepID=A0A8J3E516_9PROT|nr:hypothetical protein GCM10011611_42560 [Aliidongia dinghuensis]
MPIEEGVGQFGEDLLLGVAREDTFGRMDGDGHSDSPQLASAFAFKHRSLSIDREDSLHKQGE